MTFDLDTLMKIAVPLLLLAALIFLPGCTTNFAKRLAKMPDGRFERAKLEQTGKFTHTTIELVNATKDNGVLTASSIAVKHNDPWTQNFTFDATGYIVQLTPAEKRKPLPASVPSVSSVVNPEVPAAK